MPWRPVAARPIGTSTICNVLRNRFYTGSFDWAGMTYAGVHEPLVTPELWDAVQEILDDRASSNIRANPRDFPFTGLIRCGHCGCAIVAEIKKERYIYYHCTGFRGKCPERYVREEVIEERFIDVLRQLRCTDEEFDDVRRSVLADQPEPNLEERVGRFRRKGQLAGAPGALAWDGVELLCMGRMMHQILKGLPSEAKRQMLSLIVSHCTWAHTKLSVTFQRPFELFIEKLDELRRVGAQDLSTSSVLREALQDPSSDIRRLIARFNAVVSAGQGDVTCLEGWELEFEAA